MKSGRLNTCTKCVGQNSARYRRDWEVKKDFGISLNEYEKLKSPCRICESKKHLHLDHNHTSGKLRGFLCVKCNMGIGQFNDDIKLLEKAILYLKEAQ